VILFFAFVAAIFCLTVSGVAYAAYVVAREKRQRRAELVARLALVGTGFGVWRGTIGERELVVRFDVRERLAWQPVSTRATIALSELPAGFSIETERRADAWQTGDERLDARVSVLGEPAFVAYALGAEQREHILTLLGAGAGCRIGGKAIELSYAHEDLPALAEAISAAGALADHLCAAPSAHAPALQERATRDPLPPMRVAAIAALRDEHPDALAAILPKLREDASPAVLLEVAIATRDAADAAHVPIDALTAAEQGDFWTYCAAALTAGDRAERLRATLAGTNAERALVERLLPWLTEDDALALLDRASGPIRLEIVQWLAARGSLRAVMPLRALQDSAPLAAAQVRACQQAVLQIQGRAEGAEAGALSVDVAARGALSEVKES
jgi:hypothetical protein